MDGVELRVPGDAPAAKKKGISGSTVKIVAIITMFIDRSCGALLWVYGYQSHWQGGISHFLFSAGRRLSQDQGCEKIRYENGSFCADIGDSF